MVDGLSYGPWGATMMHETYLWPFYVLWSMGQH